VKRGREAVIADFARWKQPEAALIGHSKPKTSRITHFPSTERPRGCDLVVVAIKLARVVERRILRAEDPTSTQNIEGLRNATGHSSLPVLCCVRPFGPTPTASTALAGAGGTASLAGALPSVSFSTLQSDDYTHDPINEL